MAAGFDVIGVDRTAPAANPGYRYFQADVTDEGAVQQALERVGPLKHVLAVAGGALANEKTAPDAAVISIDLLKQSLEQNLISAFVTLKATLPKLRLASGDRSITFVSSTDALLSYGLPAYAAAKAGIIGLVHSMASPFGKEGIRINAVAPGDVPTERNAREWAHLPHWYEDLAAATALRRLCTPEELGDAFVSVATQLRGMTGQVIVVDAGLTVAAAGNTAVPQV
jgi:NAD(P)-dependent dehydrogenase (short-subunit alcohol dehydrogenase family)